MTTENLLIFMVTNMFRSIINQRLITLFFDKSKTSIVLRSLSSIAFFVITSAGYLLYNRLEVNIMTNILGIKIMVAVFQGNIKKKILSVFLIYFLNMSCDVVVMISLQGYTGNPINQLYGSITVLIITVFEIFIEKVVRIKRNSYYIAPHWKILILVPISSMAMIHYLMLHVSKMRQTIVVVGLGLLLINIVIFYLYGAMEDTYMESLDNEVSNQLAKTYAHQLDVIMNTQDQIRSLQHDMKFHIRELMAMAEVNEVGDIVTYLDNMKEMTNNPNEFVYSGNREIDSNLNFMLKTARDKLKDISVEIKIPENIQLSTYDINIIISNLLENAIEAAEETEKKQLHVFIHYNKSLLYITVKNSFNGPVNQYGGEFFSTKENKLLHGYGIKNVRRIVKKYYGNIDFSSSEDIFRVDIMLYLSDDMY